jgi:hypothetical protein
MEHIITIRTSQGTYYISATESNRLMLFGEAVAVYCENRMEHIITVCTSQGTHYISATETNWLMLFIVRTIRNTHIQFVPHRKHIVSAVETNRLMLFIVRTPRNKKIHSVGRMQSFGVLK